MGDRLKGRVAVCTGSGRGIGRCVALALAAEGARVVVNDFGIERDGSKPSSGPALDVVNEIVAAGGEASPNYDSVATIAGGKAIIETAIENYGRIDILVNVAGMLKDKSLLKMTEEEWDAVMAVHMKGHFACTQAAGVYMKQQRWGRIVNFASHAIFGVFGQVNYVAAKMGIIGITRATALELGGYGVTANAVAPTARTRMTWTPEMAQVWERKKAEGQYAPELPPAEAIAPLVVYLCTDQAASINGQVLHSAGGEIGIYEYLPMARMIYKDIDQCGIWTQDELEKVMPRSINQGTLNLWPPKEEE
jgi:NAD(P)-dependent dehydrogenase (short-subunit alcohol dehydrogenase family)